MPATHLCVPCGHQCGCEPCLRQVRGGDDKCPICRVRIESLQRVFSQSADNDGAALPGGPVPPSVTAIMSTIMRDVRLQGNGRSSAMQHHSHQPEFDPEDALSVTLWVRKRGDGYNYLVSRGEWTEGYSLGILSKGDKGGAIRGALGIGGVRWQDFVGRTRIRSGKLYPVGMTFGGGEGRLFVDGVCEKKLTLGGRIKYGKTGLWIGGEALGVGNAYKNNGPRHFLDGQIAGLEILGTCKSEAEVREEFQAGAPAGI